LSLIWPPQPAIAAALKDEMNRALSGVTIDVH